MKKAFFVLLSIVFTPLMVLAALAGFLMVLIKIQWAMIKGTYSKAFELFYEYLAESDDK